MDEHAIARFYHESLVRRALQIMHDTRARVAEREVVRCRFFSRIDRRERLCRAFLLQRLPADERKGCAHLTIVAFAFQVVAGHGQSYAVEAEPCEAAGFRKRQHVRAIVVADAQHNAIVGTTRLPIPIVRVDQHAIGSPFRLYDDRGASIRPALGQQSGAQRWPSSELQQFGARVHQHDVRYWKVRALGDPFHLLDMPGIEVGYYRQIEIDQFLKRDLAEPRSFHLGDIMCRATADFGRGALPIADAALTRLTPDFQKTACVCHPAQSPL